MLNFKKIFCVVIGIVVGCFLLYKLYEKVNYDDFTFSEFKMEENMLFSTITGTIVNNSERTCNDVKILFTLYSGTIKEEREVRIKSVVEGKSKYFVKERIPNIYAGYQIKVRVIKCLE